MMTTIMAVKCYDGLVFHSDSLFTDEVYNKVREGSKLFILPIVQDRNFVLGLAGNFYQYDTVRQVFEDQFQDKELLKKDECRKRLEDIAPILRKKYDVEKLIKAGYEINTRTREVQVQGLLGAKLTNNEFAIFHFDAYNDPFEEGEYTSIGEGGEYADFIFKSVIPPVFQRLNLSWGSFSTDLVSRFIYLLMRRIALIGKAATGGPTNLVKIDNSGARFVPNPFNMKDGKYEPDIAIQFLATIKREKPELIKMISAMLGADGSIST
ncbi:MAG: 20S proteasome alpha/beta subunit [Candidatus Nitrosomirales archaeon]|jgi:20S proteasome alpha/beta subunit